MSIMSKNAYYKRVDTTFYKELVIKYILYSIRMNVWIY